MLDVVRRYKRFWMWGHIRETNGIRLKVCQRCKYTYVTAIRKVRMFGETCMYCPKCTDANGSCSGYPQDAIDYHQGWIPALYQWITKREYRGKLNDVKGKSDGFK